MPGHLLSSLLWRHFLRYVSCCLLCFGWIFVFTFCSRHFFYSNYQFFQFNFLRCSNNFIFWLQLEFLFEIGKLVILHRERDLISPPSDTAKYLGKYLHSYHFAASVRSIVPLYKYFTSKRSFFFLFKLVFIWTRRCAQPIPIMCRLKIKATLEG